jgi:hypothetical protein
MATAKCSLLLSGAGGVYWRVNVRARCEEGARASGLRFFGII